MLTCRPAQRLPPTDDDPYFDCSQKRVSISPRHNRLDATQSQPSIAYTRTTLLAERDKHSPCPQDASVVARCSDHMTSPSGCTQRYHNCSLSQADIERNALGSAPGLGITTNENNFTDSYHTSSFDGTSLVALDSGRASIEVNNPLKLSSPFHDQLCTPMIGWTGLYLPTTPGSSLGCRYADTVEQHYLYAQQDHNQAQYTISPDGFTPRNVEIESAQLGPFEIPIIRHNSMSSVMPSTTEYPYQTPTFEASPSDWTPQTSTPDWLSSGQLYANSSRLPAVRLDYSACIGEEHSPYMLPPQSRVKAAMTVPIRRKPRLRPSLSESCVPRTSSPARIRAASMGHFLQTHLYEHYVGNTSVEQLPLPPMPPSMLINATPLQHSNPAVSDTHVRDHRQKSSTSSNPQPRGPASSPPAPDMSSADFPCLSPTKQEPTFPGDVYTPTYRRRSPTGRWEGWCGYCQPGRWLDLKNSRYWEDKLRNHGICAKTKLHFAEPKQIRWINPDGPIVSDNELVSDQSHLCLDQSKREGLCGVCHMWIGMDGVRTKARDRAVGWWIHAYKCHDHEKTTQKQADARPAR